MVKLAKMWRPGLYFGSGIGERFNHAGLVRTDREAPHIGRGRPGSVFSRPALFGSNLRRDASGFGEPEQNPADPEKRIGLVQ